MSLAETLAPSPAGLEQVRALMAGGLRAPITELLDFRLIEAEEGRVVFEGTPNEKVYNPIGTVHGGYAATLLDSACGIAVHTKLSPAQGYTTLELKVAYHKAMTSQTGPVRAEGKVITFGRRAAFAEARITDAAGRLYATATSTLLVFDK
ncbi:MAG TPA: PaaI family thioesterase [Caulobacteraceae bacterium]